MAVMNSKLDHLKFISGESTEPAESTVKQKTHQNDLSVLPPGIFEFEAVEDVAEKSEDSFIQRKAIQRAICITSTGGEPEADVKKWQFVCKVCSRAFDSLKLCEMHILENEHTFVSSETTQDEDFDMLRFQLEMLRKMNSSTGSIEVKENATNGVELLKTREYGPVVGQDFVPIQLGNWSKVICELRHRFGQVCNGNCKNTSVPNFINEGVSSDQTFPKTVQLISTGPEATAKPTLQNENLQKSSDVEATIGKNENDSKSDKIEISFSNNFQEEIKNPVVTECESSKTSLMTELSELPLETDLPKEQNAGTEHTDLSPNTSESSNCPADKTKVFLDYVTRLLYCESCGTTFNTIDQALSHLKTDGDSEKSADQFTWDEYDMLHQNHDDKVEIPADEKSPQSGEVQTAGINDHVSQDTDRHKSFTNFDDSNETQQEPQPPSEKSPLEFADTLPSTSKFDSNDLNDNSSLDSYSEKAPLFERPIDKKKQKRKKKKKKRKAWRIVKRTVMYTITFLF